MSKHNAEICRVVAGDETEGVTNLARAVVIRGLHWRHVWRDLRFAVLGFHRWARAVVGCVVPQDRTTETGIGKCTREFAVQGGPVVRSRPEEEQPQ